jgi:hypothetical protein
MPRTVDGERYSLQQKALGKLVTHRQKNEVEPLQCNKNSKLIKYLNIISKTIKLLEKKTGETLHDIASGNDFLDVDSKNTGNNDNKNKLNFIKIKNICAPKDNNRVKRKPTK